jgi:hypothetical protein
MRHLRIGLTLCAVLVLLAAVVPLASALSLSDKPVASTGIRPVDTTDKPVRACIDLVCRDNSSGRANCTCERDRTRIRRWGR